MPSRTIHDHRDWFPVVAEKFGYSRRKMTMTLDDTDARMPLRPGLGYGLRRREDEDGVHSLMVFATANDLSNCKLTIEDPNDDFNKNFIDVDMGPDDRTRMFDDLSAKEDRGRIGDVKDVCDQPQRTKPTASGARYSPEDGPAPARRPEGWLKKRGRSASFAKLRD